MTDVNLHDTTDARVWADEFCKNWPTALSQIPGREGVETEEDFNDIMVVWFANAIMAGVDSVSASSPAAVTVDREAIARTIVKSDRAWNADESITQDWADFLADSILSALTPAPVAGWRGVPISTFERLPEKPGKRSYEHVRCLIFIKGEWEVGMWNCEHLVWDDDEGDDFRYHPTEPTHWMPLPPAPGQPATEGPEAVQQAARITIAEAIDALKQCKTPATCTEFLQRNIGIESGIAALRALEGPDAVQEAARVLLNDPVAFRTMATAARRSRAKDDEGLLPPLFDLLDFSGENKTKTVVDAAIRAALRALISQAQNTTEGDA